MPPRLPSRPIRPGRGLPYGTAHGNVGQLIPNTYPGWYVRVSGIREARAALEGWEAAARLVGNFRFTLGSPLVYAHWIEFGRHRRDRSRFTRPVLYMTRAMRDGRDWLARNLGPAVFRAGPTKGRSVQRVLEAFSNRVLQQARRYVTVRSGQLRGSLRVRLFGSAVASGRPFGTRG